MSKEELKIAEDGSVEFDFGFDTFRPMGFTFDGVVVKARIEKPEKETFSFLDKRTNQMVTKAAKPQLILLVQPTDHKTKTGNPYPEYLPLTHNSRSKLGIIVEHLQKLGISLGSDPAKLEGMEFTWEIKEVNFGGSEPTRVMCPVAQVDALNSAVSAVAVAAPAARSGFSDIDADTISAIVTALDGTSTDVAITAVSRAVRNPRVIAGMADGSLTDFLQEKGLISVASGRYVASVAAAA